MRFKLEIFSGCFLIVMVALSSSAAGSTDAPLVEAARNRDKQAMVSLLKQPGAASARQPDGTTALHWAAHWNDPEAAELLIGAGVYVNAANDYGVTALSLACENGNAAMVEKLLRAEANPNAAQSSGETALMTCARSGDANSVKLLLDFGADVNAKESRRGQTALMWAVAEKHPEVVRVLAAHGADVSGRSKDGFTPLMFAAREGDLDSARVLLEAGANVNESAPQYGTPLVEASGSGHEDLAIFLLDKGADPNAVDQYGTTALHYAMMRGILGLNGTRRVNFTLYLFRPNMVNLINALLARGASPNARSSDDGPLAGATPLLLAAASGDTNLMRVLTAKGADPLVQTKRKLTLLMAAVGQNSDALDEEKASALDAVKVALELGADIDFANDGGRTALHLAAQTGNSPVVQFLVQKGASLQAKDKFGQTPWNLAAGVMSPACATSPVCSIQGNKQNVWQDTADLLVKLGAVPQISVGPQPASAAPANKATK